MNKKYRLTKEKRVKSYDYNPDGTRWVIVHEPVIEGTPEDILEWCLKQFKGIKAINIIMSDIGPNSNFVEAEDDSGRGIKIGKWIKYGNFWKLRITPADLIGHLILDPPKEEDKEDE